MFSKGMLGDIRTVFGLMRREPDLSADMDITKRYTNKTFVWLLLTEFYLVMQVYPVKFFMDEIVKPRPDLHKLMLIAGSMAAIAWVGNELTRHMDQNRNAANLGLWRMWWGFGHRCVLRQSTDWHVKHGTGEKMSLVSRNISRIERMFDEAMFNTVPVTLRIFYTIILMFVLGWQLGLVALATTIVYMAVVVWAARGIEPLGKQFRKDMRKAEKFADELTRNWRTIRSMGMEEDFADRNELLLKQIWFNDIPRHKKYLYYLFQSNRVIALSTMALYMVIGLSVTGGRHALSIGTIVLATTWMGRAYSNFSRYEDFLRQLREGRQALKELVKFLVSVPTIRNPDNPLWPIEIRGEVDFGEVGFDYPIHESTPEEEYE